MTIPEIAHEIIKATTFHFQNSMKTGILKPGTPEYDDAINNMGHAEAILETALENLKQHILEEKGV
jgi:hypothetical protein